VFLLNFKQRLLRIYVEHHLEARQYTKQQPEHSGKESASNRLERKTKPRHTLEHSLNNDKQSIMHFEAAPPPKKESCVILSRLHNKCNVQKQKLAMYKKTNQNRRRRRRRIKSLKPEEQLRFLFVLVPELLAAK
jgi:hypothetical protein